MIGIKERSLDAALEAAGLCRIGLPKQWRDESDGFWIKAVVLVKKRNGDRSYMLAERGADRIIHYKQDFGRMSPFIGLLSIHPYKYLDEGRFTAQEGSVEEQKAFLAANSEKTEAELASMTDKEVEEAVVDCAIEKQCENNETDRLGNDMLEKMEEEYMPIEDVIAEIAANSDSSVSIDLDGTTADVQTIEGFKFGSAHRNMNDKAKKAKAKKK